MFIVFINRKLLNLIYDVLIKFEKYLKTNPHNGLYMLKY